MAESIFIDSIVVLLLLCALVHIVLPQATESWMSRPGVVRCVGGILLLLSIPCLLWAGGLSWTLFAVLVISGVWRLCFPRHSIHAQQRTYPRWVHGCPLLGGAILVWALRP